MNIIRKNDISDWAVGCIVEYDDKYCLIAENNLTVGSYALVDVEANNIVDVFNHIEELGDVELIASDLDVDICF